MSDVPVFCAHVYVWPDGICVECEVLATMLPGHSEPAHLMIPRSPKRIRRFQWIERYGAAEIEREHLRVVPCACTDDPACLGWQVAWPGQQPSLPVRRGPEIMA